MTIKKIGDMDIELELIKLKPEDLDKEPYSLIKRFFASAVISTDDDFKKNESPSSLFSQSLGVVGLRRGNRGICNLDLTPHDYHPAYVYSGQYPNHGKAILTHLKENNFRLGRILPNSPSELEIITDIQDIPLGSGEEVISNIIKICKILDQTVEDKTYLTGISYEKIPLKILPTLAIPECNVKKITVPLEDKYFRVQRKENEHL